MLCLIQSVALQAQTTDAAMDSLRRAYIHNYKDIAMDEMERSGVPASIKLAQGILESRAGASELAMQANNHFGIKCGKDWKGKTYSKHDDERDKQGRPQRSCFRKYANVVECFADHSEFIRNPEKQFRYGALFELDPLDYKGWAEGLQQAGYSSVNYYAEKLIFLIERYRMYEYDREVYNGRLALKRLAKVNGVKMVQARHGESLRDIARLYHLKLDSLLAYNDRQYLPDQPLGMGSWVYMQAKRGSWDGPAEFHRVDTDQSLFAIAQLYGIRLDRLRLMNGLKEGEEPALNEKVRLRGKRGPGEQIRLVRNIAETTGMPNDPTPATRDAAPATARPIVEMLPEEVLPEPVPVYMDPAPRAEKETEMSGTFSGDFPDPAPLVILDTETGETEIYHTVSKGDTLYSIARRYGISATRIREKNRMKDNRIKIGQILRVN